MADETTFQDLKPAHLAALLMMLVSGEDNDGARIYPPREICGLRPDGDVAEILIDRVTNALAGLTTDHLYIHEGIAFTLEGTQAIAGSSTFAIEFTTPADKYVHFKGLWIAASGGPIVATLVQGATSSGGSAKAAYNCNHLSNKTAATVTKTGVTSSQGTVKRTLFIPSSTLGAQRLGGSTSGGPEENVLARSTTYTLVIQNQAASETTIGYSVFWYEEEGA